MVQKASFRNHPSRIPPTANMKFVVLALALIGAASAGYVSPVGGFGYGGAIAPAVTAAPIAAYGHGYAAPTVAAYGHGYAAPAVAAYGHGYAAPAVAAYGHGIGAPAIGGFGHAYAAPAWGYGGLWKKKKASA